MKIRDIRRGNKTTSNIKDLSIGNVSGVGQPATTSSWGGMGMSYTVANCCYLNQGITEAKDGALDKLKGFDSLEGMTGNSMKSIGPPVVVFLFTVYA